MSGDSRTPVKLDPGILQDIRDNKDFDDAKKARFLDYFKRELAGLVVLDTNADYERCYPVGNLNISECFTCNEFTVWVHERVLFPPSTQGPPPNTDLPTEVANDYREASTILALSPRGAAALLRLAIQKLCVELGEKGTRIDDDIASLVKKGLSPVVQQALDTVRVIGNEAVHPGTLDLKDDTSTAERLFTLVNIIAEQTITNPKHVKELYGMVPPEKIKAIEKRDAKA
jgi:hypothetical protein